MKAYLKNYRQSPRKVRLVASLVRGKGVKEATMELDFLAKRAGVPIKKLILSALSNAKEMGVDEGNLFIKELRVDQGVIIKRMKPAAMGSGHRINKRNSHIRVVLAEKAPVEKAVSAKKQSKTKKSTVAKAPVSK